MMWIGSLALAGIPPFAGYYSKDAIIDAALCRRHAASACTASSAPSLAAFLTAFYSWRLLFMTLPRHVARRPPRAGARARKPLGDARCRCWCWPSARCSPAWLLDHTVHRSRTGRHSGTAASSTRPTTTCLRRMEEMPGVGSRWRRWSCASARHRGGLCDVYRHPAAADAARHRCSAASTCSC